MEQSMLSVIIFEFSFRGEDCFVQLLRNGGKMLRELGSESKQYGG